MHRVSENFMRDIKKMALDQIQGALGTEQQYDEPRFKRLNSWTLLLIFLDESHRAFGLSEKYGNLKSIDVGEQVMVSHALFRAAILAYAKCFASAGQGRITLDRNDVFKSRDDLISYHERMISIRNGFAAHNGDNDMDTATIAVREYDNEIVVRHMYTMVTPIDEFPDFMRVVEHCQSHVLLGVTRYIERLAKDIGKSIRIGE